MDALSIFKKKRMIVLAIYFGFMIIYYFGMNLSLSLKLNSVSMPSYAERVLPPKRGYFTCCAGSRVGMEEVYRIPKDKVDDISYGEINRVVVEPFYESLYLNDLKVSVGGFESDCSYVYDYGDVVRLPEYRDDDGYCYIHVWGREYLGSGDGFTLYLLAIFSIYLVLPIVVFVIALKLLMYKVKNRKKKKSVEKETLHG